jgi:hypothetical protein
MTQKQIIAEQQERIMELASDLVLRDKIINELRLRIKLLQTELNNKKKWWKILK